MTAIFFKFNTQQSTFGLHINMVKSMVIMIRNKGAGCNPGTAGVSFVFHASFISAHKDLCRVVGLLNKIHVDTHIFEFMIVPYLPAFFKNIEMLNILFKFYKMRRPCIQNKISMIFPDLVNITHF